MGVQFAGNILVQSNGGPLPISMGGTGQTTATGARTALLPVQTGETGKVLTTNGTDVYWANAAGGSAGGSDTQIQFNDAGTLNGSANLVINKTTGAVTGTSTFTTSGFNATASAGTARPLKFLTGSSDRWILQADSTAESGSNAGSNLTLTRVADNGTTQNLVFTVTRSTGVLNFATPPTVEGIEIGYRVLPRVTTFDASARGKRVAIAAGVTIPANTYVAGDAFSFYNDSASAVTITQGASLTLRQDGTANTGNRTLAARGTCFVWFNSATEAIISGSIT